MFVPNDVVCLFAESINVVRKKIARPKIYIIQYVQCMFHYIRAAATSCKYDCEYRRLRWINYAVFSNLFFNVIPLGKIYCVT